MMFKNTVRTSIGWNVIVFIILLAGSLLMLIPFLWMITTSVKEQAAVFLSPPQWIPDPIILQNYVRAWTMFPMGTAYLNSFKISISVTLGTLLSCSMAGYAFAKMEFAAKRLCFILLLATIMIPGQVTLIPTFLWFKQINWLNTHWPLIIPPLLTNAFGVFLLRQYMTSIPNELEDAGRIDGLNPWGIYRFIVIPNSKPALAALGIFTFLYHWNNFLGPLIYLNSAEKYTLPLMVASFQGLYGTDWTLLMAASCITLLPVLILYLFAQRYFIEGITLSGLKG